MWAQAHRYTLTCVCNEQRENKIPSPHRVFPTNLDATVVLLRATDEESEQVETLTAIWQSHLRSCKSSRQAVWEAPPWRVAATPADSAGLPVPAAGPILSQLPTSSTFRFKQWTTYSYSRKPNYFMSQCTRSLFVQDFSSLSPSKHPFFLQDLAHVSFVLWDPRPSESSLPGLYHHLPTNMLPSYARPGFRSKGYAFYTSAGLVWQEPDTRQAINKFLLNPISKMKTPQRQTLHLPLPTPSTYQII